jgi:prepilin peptidase CpaA
MSNLPEAFPILHVFALVITLVCAITDLRTGRIYNRVTYPAIAVGLGWHIASGSGVQIASSVGGLAAGVVPLGLAAMRGWIGGGDVKLFGAVGAALGVFLLVDVVLMSFVLAAVYGSVVLILREGARAMFQRFAAGVRMMLRLESVDMDDAEPLPTLRMGLFIFLGTGIVLGVIFLTP